MNVFSGGPSLLLVNPTAGRGRGVRLLPRVLGALEAEGITPIVSITESLGQATSQARTAAPGSLVAVLGGDGFLGAAAGGAAESGAILLPLAGGRGNDTVRRLGLGLDPVKSIRSIEELRVHHLDLGVVNGRPYLGVANVGFDGLANENGNRAAMNLGPFTYLYGGLKALAHWKNVTFTLTVDGKPCTFPGWFIAVGNVGQYGGGLRIAPDALVDDGLLDVVSLGRAGILGVAATFLRSYRGHHTGQSNISLVRGHTVEISASMPLNIYADGELVAALSASIGIHPRALSMLAPAGSPAFSDIGGTGDARPRR
ncbi:diacylglycerol/lipid kinase family protein [Paeniglutamicibacter cryotolerans]|uniref:YegS/Rv2252/BmrU family lipid kinase n=1 Tax=Paeniglutamicibacter cryotolerans TaxID=670079 RepID=A0A839QUM9_9MICC|nr:diacylglycerol kinase family protein [Paeniglutamicibacter cryotolerans]MBB2996992.1 YegS/Rv2252/BmrU family lipid kinase [Paeniglutamicibacter cryotolerans]